MRLETRTQQKRVRALHGREQTSTQENLMAPPDVRILFIVNGEDVPVNANLHEPLASARDRALAESKNIGRNFSEWEIRNDQGVLLDPAEKVGAFGFASGVKLFLTLKVGAGGSC